MPYLDVNGARLYCESYGSGPETIVFSHGLLMSSGMYRAQIDALAKRYRCIAYDHRGQGRSEVTETGYDMDALTLDAATLILVGDEDVATPPAKSERMKEAIAGARLEVIPRAGHSAPVEQPAVVTRSLERFLDAIPSSAALS